MVAISNQFAKSERSFLLSHLAAWRGHVEETAVARRKKEQHFNVAQRTIANSGEALLAQCFAAWVRSTKDTLYDSKLQNSQQRLCEQQVCANESRAKQKERMKAVMMRQLANSDQQLSGAVFLAWRRHVEEIGVAKKKREATMTMIAGTLDGFLSQCMVAWRCIALAVLRDKMRAVSLQLQDKCIDLRSRATAPGRVAAERVGIHLNQILLVQCVAAWHLRARMEAMVSSDSRRFRRCSSLALRLRARLQLEAAWLRWSLYYRMKPQAPLLSLRGAQTKGVQAAPEFCAEPPTFYVRPGPGLGSKWPITHVDSVHGAGKAASLTRQVALEVPFQPASHPQAMNCTSRPSATEANSGEGRTQAAALVAAVASAGHTTNAATTSLAVANHATARGLLTPTDRFMLANQASVSDGDYRRLLDYNRREIRESRDGDDAPSCGLGRLDGAEQISSAIVEYSR